MNRIPYLTPLVNFLKASTTLNNHGIPGLPDMKGKNIFVVSAYDGLATLNNFFFGVIIHPMGSVQVEQDERIKCDGNLEHKVMIAAMVKNARSLQAHFQENVSGSNTSYTGAYPMAAAFEEIIRKTILEFNASIESESSTITDFTPFRLVELPEPDEHNDLLVMPMIYKTSYVF